MDEFFDAMNDIATFTFTTTPYADPVLNWNEFATFVDPKIDCKAEFGAGDIGLEP